MANEPSLHLQDFCSCDDFIISSVLIHIYQSVTILHDGLGTNIIVKYDQLV